MRPSRKKLAEVISQRLSRGEGSARLAREVAAYLLSSGRSNELESIMRDVIEIRADHGQVESTLTTAHEPSSRVQKDVKKLITAIRPGTKNVVIDQRLDPDLIGGLKLNVVNQSLDLSIRAKINKLKQLTTQGGA